MIEWADIPDENTFARLVSHAPTPVIVAFETDDCGHCRQQRSLLALAWRHLGWSTPTFRLDASRLPHLADEHRIAGYPTIAVFSDGRLVERFPGRRDPAALTRRLTTLLPPGLTTAGGASSRTARPAALLPAPPVEFSQTGRADGLPVCRQPALPGLASAKPGAAGPRGCRCTD